jgi:hypothetical protein
VSAYRAVVVARADYDALPPRTKRLFDVDKAKIERDPYSPPGLASRPVARDEDFRTSVIADGEVVIEYRIMRREVQVRIVRIVNPG